MIVEFIGCTGAGKTTLIEDVKRNLSSKAQVAVSFDLVAEQVGVRGLKSRTAKNFIAEIVGFPFFVRSLNQHWKFLTYNWRMLRRHYGLSFKMINYLRSLERKIGLFEVIKRGNPDQIILSDEGTILSAHNLFVFTHKNYPPEEVARFASLAPLPDKVVYVKVPVNTLVQRTLSRPDAPREMKSKEPLLIEKHMRRAAAMFEQLIETENIFSRLLVVESCGFNDREYLPMIDRIADFILEKKTSHSQTKESSRSYPYPSKISEPNRL